MMRTKIEGMIFNLMYSIKYTTTTPRKKFYLKFKNRFLNSALQFEVKTPLEQI